MYNGGKGLYTGGIELKRILFHSCSFEKYKHLSSIFSLSRLSDIRSQWTKNSNWPFYVGENDGHFQQYIRTGFSFVISNSRFLLFVINNEAQNWELFLMFFSINNSVFGNLLFSCET